MTEEGLYLTFIPTKDGEPEALSIAKVLVEKVGDKILEGSLRIFIVVLPVLVRVTATERFSTSTTESAPVTTVSAYKTSG